MLAFGAGDSGSNPDGTTHFLSVTVESGYCYVFRMIHCTNDIIIIIIMYK